MHLQINEEFKQLIPQLSQEELVGLENSLKLEGCRDPLVVWHNTIIDGHHRYAICIKHSISFNIIEKMELETELDVKLWMINNQFSRRNLTNIQKAELAIEMEKTEQVQAKARQGARNDLKNDNIPPDLGECSRQGESLVAAAKAVGLSYETVRKTKPSKLIINEIIEAEARASLIDAMVFTPEAATTLKKGSENFINQLIEENNE